MAQKSPGRSTHVLRKGSHPFLPPQYPKNSIIINVILHPKQTHRDTGIIGRHLRKVLFLGEHDKQTGARRTMLGPLMRKVLPGHKAPAGTVTFQSRAYIRWSRKVLPCSGLFLGPSDPKARDNRLRVALFRQPRYMHL